METAKRKIEVFLAGCPTCDGVVSLVKSLICPSCELQIYDLRRGCETNECRAKARRYGISAAPPIAVNGVLLDRCRRVPLTADRLVAAGIGQPL